ncbi:NYN domain-containing protein, partial [Myxococcota bacterium]|nr:NYN domain-containing protein [Myxococcota bacterium]
MSEEPLIAVFVDFENLALGVRDMKGGRLKIDVVLKRLLEKGRIVFKRAYCDWSGYRDDVRDFHVNGVELVDIPRSKASGKNCADIHMVVDALDLCYSKDHIDCFALLTGDSDFSPLVSKLKENDKRVIGCGVKQSTSSLLIANCDEFIYYDDLVRAMEKSGPKREHSGRARSGQGKEEKLKVKPKPPEPVGDAAERKPEAMDQLMEIVESLSQDYELIWGSMIKQTIRRVYPSFNESYLGYRNFAELLKHAAEEGAIELD